MLSTLVLAAVFLGADPDPMMYPGARLLSSGQGGGGGGVPRRGIAAKNQLATTPDAFAKVVEFYDQKFDAVGFAGTRAEAGGGKGNALSVITSPGRPVDLKIYVKYEPNAATTVVVSRGPGEKETSVQIVTNSHTFGP